MGQYVAADAGPFRVAALLVAGVWGWALNLHYLTAIKIDVPTLLRYPRPSSSAAVPAYKSAYRLAALLTAPLLVAFILSVAGASNNSLALPLVALVSFFSLLLLPIHRLARTGRRRFAATLRRVSIGGLADDAITGTGTNIEGPGSKFADILLADVVTSYARVLADLYICVLAALTGAGTDADAGFGGGTLGSGQHRHGDGTAAVVQLIVALPSLMRLRQCLAEFGRERRRASASGGGSGSRRGAGSQHLANALKYASAFPPIVLAAAERRAGGGQQAGALHRLWVAAALLNSTYSFYWDVARDWDLPLFPAIARVVANTLGISSLSSSFSDSNPNDDYYSPTTTTPSTLTARPFGLRRHRYLHVAPLYYAAVVSDLGLRFAWLVRLWLGGGTGGPVSGTGAPGSGSGDAGTRVQSSSASGVGYVPAAADTGVFVLMALELVRRWMWVFVRVETEWVRSNRGPSLDDVMLGDYIGKADED